MFYLNCVLAVGKMSVFYACTDREGGTGGLDDPLKSHNNIGFLNNTGPDPLKHHKATKPAFNKGPSSARQRNAILIAGIPVSIAFVRDRY